MRITAAITALSFVLILISGCASEIREVPATETPIEMSSANLTVPVVQGLKHRIAIAKFEDKTGYGNNLFGQINDLGGQASDMLASHLIKAGRYIVVERENLKDLRSENELQGQSNDFVGVSALVFGAVTEFGTKTEWVDAGLSKTKTQVARAKVSIRLVDPQSGVAFFSEFGEASATNESSQTLGFGGKSTYDATLGDRALNGAIAKLVGNMMSSLNALEWKTQVIDTSDGIIIGAGAPSGLNIGDILVVRAAPRKIRNPSTNAIIMKPGARVGKIRVETLIGSSDLDQAAICSIVEGSGFKVGQEVLENSK
ncbi:MAG: hypothetical protein OEZ43_07495 [Gammaproteobacteria bacterium]|nr:hypothetical protein [Gammaproteobacteria bacterium]